MTKSGLIPTSRAVIDINRPCNAKCRMCYYTYEKANWSKPFADVQGELRAARERGNTSVDFTGGEPTIYPEMADVIRYAESIGLHTCIITNGLALEKIKGLVDAGCREWLVSVHGLREKHDQLLNVPGAWKKVNETIDYLNEQHCFIRTNSTITRYNAQDLPKLAQYLSEFVKPRIVNFINFNPHYQWGHQKQPEVYERLNEVQVPVSEVSPHLRQALDVLTARRIWTNVRYFPFCALKGYENHICNNPQVMFDPYEWDYGVAPKNVEAYLAQGRSFQENIGYREGACGKCGIRDVCGGVHKNYAKLHGDTELSPYLEQSDHPYFFYKDIEVDIIVPTYQPNQQLQDLLLSISQKTVPPYNLILVSKMQSAARNRNYGMERSNSPYVIMCDDDITDLPFAWNRQLVYRLRENPDILAISARLKNQDGSLGKNSANNFDLSRPLVDVKMIPTACCVFRNTALRFDERYLRAGWEDTDFFMQLKQEFGGTFAIANDVSVVHLNEEKNNGGRNNRYNEQLFREKWQDNQTVNLGCPAPDFVLKPCESPILEHLKRGDLQGAITLCHQSLTGSKDDAAIYNNLACAYWHHGSPEDSLGCLYQAATLSPNDKDILLNFIKAAYELNRFPLLEGYLRMTVKRNPRSVDLLFLFADCLFRQDKYRESQKVLGELLAYAPDYPGAIELSEQLSAGTEGENLSYRCPSDVPPCSAEQDASSIDIRKFNHARYMTKRGAIDVGHICDINCLFCYHRFEDRKQRSFLSKQEIMERLRRDREEYDLTVTDFTGGEPTIHPDIAEIVGYGNRIGNRVCLISHGQWRKLSRIDAIIDAGVHEFLLSIHGVEKDHDEATNPGAFQRILKSIEHLEKRKVGWRVNCVANARNMQRFAEYAEMICSLGHPPGNANFIVFSPLAGWSEKEQIDFQARHSELAPNLRSAIEIFSAHDIWVNVRYYPMCMLPGLEQHVTCFPQICYDPLEWDYRSYTNVPAENIMKIYQMGKQSEVYAETDDHLFHNTWSLMQSQRLYKKGPQCVECRLRIICDGLAEQYRKRFGFDELVAQPGELIRDPIHFRRNYPTAVGN